MKTEFNLTQKSNTELKAIRNFLRLDVPECAELIGGVTIRTWVRWEKNYIIPEDVIEKVKNLLALRQEIYDSHKALDNDDLNKVYRDFLFLSDDKGFPVDKLDVIYNKVKLSALSQLIVDRISHAKLF